MILKNYKNETVFLDTETLNHIKEFHKEITVKIIKDTLKNPDEIRASTNNLNSELYYIHKNENRFYCVIVKMCFDGNFISTALTTSNIKKGKLIYKGGTK